VTLAQPPAVAFAYLADPRHRPEWQSSLRSVDVPGDPTPHVGLRWRETTVVGVRPRLVVTERTPYDVWAEQGSWYGVSATLRLRFAPRGEGCRVRAEGEVSGRGPWAVPAMLAGLLAGPAIAADLRRAGRVLTRRGRPV
jgi:hypothetical protein